MGDWNNFGGVHHVTGPVNVGSGQQTVGSFVSVPPGLIQDVGALRQALEGLRLSAGERATAGRELAAVEQVVATGAADPEQVGGRLRAFVRVLRDAGALATAGGALVGPLTRIAQWLGPAAGAALLALL